MPPGRAANRLHYAFYALAAFELLTIAGALYLTHRLTAIFDQSVTADRAWQLRVRSYAELDHAVLDLRIPLDAVLVSGDAAGDQRTFSTALAAFERLASAGRQEAGHITQDAARGRILAGFDRVDAASREIAQRGAPVFTAAGTRPDAAIANRRQAEQSLLALRQATIALQNDAIESGVSGLERQEHVADAVRGVETAIGIALALVVAAAVLYGRQISRQMQEASAERERYVEALRASEQALRRTEERLQLAARATNDALRDWEITTDTIWWNDTFAALFAAEGVPRTLAGWTSLIHPDDRDRVGHSLQQFLAGGSELWLAEYRFARREGGFAWVLDRGLAVRETTGAARRMISSMMNITERKEAERMKSDFVSFVSHQLRTPLSGMSWMLELAADSEGLPEPAREYIGDARESAARLATLVNDLLDIARLESGRLVEARERLSLSALTTAIATEVRPHAAEKGLTLDVRCDPGEPAVHADPQLLRQVVTNLLSNAVKYTPRGGRVDVRLGHDNGSVSWSVRDTGVGVPRRAQARLFEKFYRADNAVALETEGTGLGLHLVRLFVEQAGGRVWCESEEGQGATFTFTLPAAAEEAAT